MNLFEKLGELGVFFSDWIAFLKKNKAWWLIPIIISLAFLGMFIFLLEGTAVAPFVYTLF